jgi:hypothetical protein
MAHTYENEHHAQRSTPSRIQRSNLVRESRTSMMTMNTAHEPEHRSTPRRISSSASHSINTTRTLKLRLVWGINGSREDDLRHGVPCTRSSISHRTGTLVAYIQMGILTCCSKPTASTHHTCRRRGLMPEDLACHISHRTAYMCKPVSMAYAKP